MDLEILLYGSASLNHYAVLGASLFKNGIVKISNERFCLLLFPVDLVSVEVIWILKNAY